MRPWRSRIARSSRVSRSSSAARAAAGSSRRPATRCAVSGCDPPCPCVRRCGVVPRQSSCTRAWRATRKSRIRCSRFFVNSRPWWKACRWTKPSSTSRPASNCSGSRRRSARKFAAASPRKPGLTASVGIAPNKLLAKIASDLNKPDGMCRIDAGNIREILDPLPIHKLFGVGQKTLPTVLAAGIRTFGDARTASDEVLWRAFGKHGKAMRDRAAGLDDRPVEAEREEKSISAEETFDTDIRAAGGTPRAAQGFGGSHRLAPAGAEAAGRPREREDPPRRFYDLYPPARRSSRRLRIRPSYPRPRKRCSAAGWLDSPAPPFGCWGWG